MQTITKLLKSIFLVDLLKGLWVTLKYTPQPAFTFQYPAERRPTAPRFRGVLRLQTEPGTGAQTCIVCDQCAKACPDDLIALGGHREPGTKIKVLDYFDFNLSRCSFCGLCSEVCPTKPIKALIMSEDYELGSYSREAQILRVDEMYDGVPISTPADAESSRSRAAGPRSRPRGASRRGAIRGVINVARHPVDRSRRPGGHRVVRHSG
jgi:NADH-quinone oxidoreductase subunit I